MSRVTQESLLLFCYAYFVEANKFAGKQKSAVFCYPLFKEEKDSCFSTSYRITVSINCYTIVVYEAESELNSFIGIQSLVKSRAV